MFILIQERWDCKGGRGAAGLGLVQSLPRPLFRRVSFSNFFHDSCQDMQTSSYIRTLAIKTEIHLLLSSVPTKLMRHLCKPAVQSQQIENFCNRNLHYSLDESNSRSRSPIKTLASSGDEPFTYSHLNLDDDEIRLVVLHPRGT
jgi:hypothetical protein